jgi:threonine dehydratase
MNTALARIRAAAERLKPHIRHTPTVYSHTFSESSGSDVWLKLENLQRTGSFKLRGALNKIQLLSAAERSRGLVAASAGNHAQGVALAAKLLGCQATIVMPLSTPINKVQRTESYGARVVLQGASYDKSQEHVQELVEREGFTLVHPFDDPDVIDGQGTIGLEVLQDLPQVDTIAVSIGGGGLISGIARAVKALKPTVRIIGVQAAGASPTVASFRARKPVAIERPETIADGIRVGTTGTHTLPTILELVDDCVTVEDHEIADAVVQTME